MATSMSRLTHDECAERVLALIAKTQRLPLERLSLQTTFAELAIGSLDAINLVFVLEDTFGIVVPEDRMHFQTVGEVVAAMQEHLCQLPSAAAPVRGMAP
jgi:acyl carrier protein